jgi:hypothetical protein
VLAKAHKLVFTGTVVEDDTVRIGDTVFEFTAGAASQPSYIAVTLGDGSAAVATANLYAAYTANPGIASATVIGTDTFSVSHNLQAFEVANYATDVDQSAIATFRDGSANISLVLPEDQPYTAGDTFELTFGPVTRPDGRTLDSVMASVSVA